MNFTFTITYSDSLVGSAAVHMWWRRTGMTYVLALVLLSASVATLLISGDRSWWTGVIATVLVLGIAVPLAGLLVQWRGSLQKSRELESGQAQVSLTSEGLRFSGRSGAVEFPWAKLRFVVRYPQYWLVGPTKHQLFILSLIGFPVEAQEFMAHQVREHQGTVA